MSLSLPPRLKIYLTGLLKLYLRELPEPLVTEAVCTRILALVAAATSATSLLLPAAESATDDRDKDTDKDKHALGLSPQDQLELADAIKSLTWAHKRVLRHLLHLGADIAMRHSLNKVYPPTIPVLLNLLVYEALSY